MFKLTVAKMTPAGHVVIPKDVCKRLNLKSGAQFIVVGRGDLGVMKSVSPQTLELIETLVDSFNGLLERVGLMGGRSRSGARGARAAKRKRPGAAVYQ